MEVTLTTINVQGFQDWQDRQQKIVSYLKAEQPAVILLQEVTYIPEVSSRTQASLLNDQLRYPYEQNSITRLQSSPLYSDYREGLAVLSQYPIMKSETLVLRKHPDDEHNRLVQFVDVMLPNGSVLKLANVHFSITDDTEEYARRHLEEVMGILKTRNETRIIGGDFNMRQLEPHADLWQADYEASSYVPYITYPEEHKRMDYFLIPKDYSFESIKTSSDGLSDHRALTTKILLPASVGSFTAGLRRLFSHSDH